MAERHKREAKLNRGRKAKNKGREVLPNTKKSTSTEVINQEHKEIIKWFQTVKFRRTLFGGVDENDVWKKLQELNQLYESAIRAERERYNILLTDHEKTYESQIYKYTPKGNDAPIISIKIYNGEDIIGDAQLAKPYHSEYQEEKVSLDINYHGNFRTPATHLEIIFESGSNTEVSKFHNNTDDAMPMFIGSQLYIDEVELIYE